MASLPQKWPTMSNILRLYQKNEEEYVEGEYYEEIYEEKEEWEIQDVKITPTEQPEN